MIYLKEFDSHASYESELNGGGVDISLPNVSYCKDANDVHFNPYNLIEFYVSEITPPQTVKIYTDQTTFYEVQVSGGNKWYTYVLPKDKGLYMIKGDAVKKAVVKADISFFSNSVFPNPNLIIIPNSTVEASFKGSSKLINVNGMFNHCSGLTSLDVSSFDTSNITIMKFMFYDCESLTSLDVSNFNTSKVTDMSNMFQLCKGLKSLDLSGWDMSKVTDTSNMFSGCEALREIKMVGCNQTTINKITAVKPSGATIIS